MILLLRPLQTLRGEPKPLINRHRQPMRCLVLNRGDVEQAAGEGVVVVVGGGALGVGLLGVVVLVVVDAAVAAVPAAFEGLLLLSGEEVLGVVPCGVGLR